MRWLPTPVRRLAMTLAAIVIVVTPSVVTLWVSTPSGSDIQQRVRDVTNGYGVVLLTEDEIPLLLAQAVVATEDERFYSHHGIDTIGLGRAFLYDVTHLCPCEGGSTITEQLVKDVYLNGNDEGYSKLVDTVMALKVERILTKKQIMADYLSEITTGYGRYGVSAAACAYFHAPLGSLTLAQYALLAGVTQAPSIYDPTVNPDLATHRRSAVLRAMVSEKFITPAQAAGANAEPVLAQGAPASGCSV
ncbi:MAG TPA: biosynthetic peptidoglycan transglycosylase [Candidatus Dormibacteraeota bacterium]|nr:biosynthetic peptidoglycan transglycosylase [Candidatus Dormibacteraeota bacterium]